MTVVVSQDITDLRSLLDPAGHKASLESARSILVKRLSDWFVELDTVVNNPEIEELMKTTQVESFEKQIRDAAWRMKAIDKMLEQLAAAQAAAVAAPDLKAPTPLSELKATDAGAPD